MWLLTRATHPFPLPSVGSLMFNTVGFYQMSKLAVAPVSVAIESAFFGRRYGVNVVMALFVLCVGLAVSSVTDLELSARGLFFSVVAGFPFLLGGRLF